MKGRRQRGAEGDAAAAFVLTAALIALAMAIGGCSTAREQQPIAMAPVSLQTLQFFPYQVKGYQNSYPKRSLVVLTPAILRNFADAGSVGGADHAPYQGHPAIGVILDLHDQVDQRLYGPELGPLFRAAIAEAAHEAGMNSAIATDSLHDELQSRRADYVLAAVVTGLWVVKQRGKDNEGGPTWFSAARVAINVAIYKPPFEVPFWQGASGAQYDDPSMPLAGALPEEETEIYDQPGEVLSVALTRAAAGIFQHDDLHTLMLEDAAGRHP